jgi:hypothetical protein
VPTVWREDAVRKSEIVLVPTVWREDAVRKSEIVLVPTVWREDAVRTSRQPVEYGDLSRDQTDHPENRGSGRNQSNYLKGSVTVV